MRIPVSLVALASIPLLGGCATSRQFDPLPDYAYLEAPVEQAAPKDGSIFSGGGVYLFEDDRARRVGDVLTIKLVEKTTAKKDANTELKKDNQQTITNPTVFGTTPELSLPGATPLAKTKDINLGFDLKSKHNFKGEADSDQSNSLKGDISATVIAVRPNGNLVVRGEKIITLNQGDERVGIVGEVRPSDIGPDNTVSSTRVANSRIIYDGTGPLDNTNTMGWLGRFFISALMPF